MCVSMVTCFHGNAVPYKIPQAFATESRSYKHYRYATPLLSHTHPCLIYISRIAEIGLVKDKGRSKSVPFGIIHANTRVIFEKKQVSKLEIVY